jgi:hypothetical protein
VAPLDREQRQTFEPTDGPRRGERDHPSSCFYWAGRNGPDSVALDPEILDQLENYVTAVASMYRDNPFHSFEHALMLSCPSSLPCRALSLRHGEETGKDMASTLHDHTYGITSDPLTQFACVFSALIHDADHTGVPNSQLNQENATLARCTRVSPSRIQSTCVDL